MKQALEDKKMFSVDKRQYLVIDFFYKKATSYYPPRPKTSSLLPSPINFVLDSYSDSFDDELPKSFWWSPFKRGRRYCKSWTCLHHLRGNRSREDTNLKGSNLFFSCWFILFMYSKHIILMWKYFMSKIRCSSDFKSFVSYILSENMFCSDICLKICSTSLKLGICLASSKRENIFES